MNRKHFIGLLAAITIPAAILKFWKRRGNGHEFLTGYLPDGYPGEGCCLSFCRKCGIRADTREYQESLKDCPGGQFYLFEEGYREHGYCHKVEAEAKRWTFQDRLWVSLKPQQNQISNPEYFTVEQYDRPIGIELDPYDW